MKNEIVGFEHIHQHSDRSLLDGLGQVQEYAERSREIDQKYLCITDHGVMSAVPSQIAACEELAKKKDPYTLFPIFGCELYVNRLQPESESREQTAEFRKDLPEDQQKKFDKSNHLLAIAYNNEGYTNLVRLTSWAWIHGFYKKPRVNHDVLRRWKSGIIFTSTCANSEIATAYFDGGDDAGFDMVEKYMAMFGEHFYLELMMLDFKLQKPYDEFLIRAHARYGIPLILTQDCHYCKKEHSKNQRLMLMQKNQRTIQELEALIASGSDDVFELQDSNLWKKSETELNEKWNLDYYDTIDYDLFKQSKMNTVKICEMARGVEMDRTLKLPSLPNEKDELRALIMKGMEERGIPKTKVYLDRIKEEFDLICTKGFASYFLIEHMMVEEAMRVCPELYGFEDASVARGPGRGSQCGSLVSYLLDLHDVEPIQHDLLFSRFLSPARGGLQMKTRFTIEELKGTHV